MSDQTFSGPTVGEQTLRVLARYPQRIAFCDSAGTETTYSATADLIGRYQSVLASHGLTPGATVALLSANRIESWCAGVAAQASGMALTWLHPLGSLADQRKQIDQCEADALIVDEQNYGTRGGDLNGTFTFGPASYGIALDAECDRIGTVRPHDFGRVDDIATINYTGGTTGEPRGVIRYHPQVTATTQAILADFEFPDTPRYLAIAPNSHVGGSLLLPVLARGGTIYLQTGFSPGAVIDAIIRDHVNMTLLVPTMIYALLDELEDRRVGPTDIQALELLLYGAAPMAQTRLSEGLMRLGQVFAQLYGQSEYHPISYLSRADHADPELHASCGVPTTVTAVRLLDGAEAEVALGEVGEIAVRGPMAMVSYLKDPQPPYQDGWLRTGDVARMDDRGYLYIADRVKDMIVTGGFNVYPREVEDALTAHPDVKAAAVFGVPDPRWGEAVTAIVQLRVGADTDLDHIIAHVKELKGSHQTPKALHLVDELPRTPIGKIDKKELRRRFS